MFLRILAVFALLSLGAVVPAMAGDFPPHDGCKGYGCPPNTPVPPPHNIPTPPPMQEGLCSGVFDGWYFGQPGPVTFVIQQVGPAGELAVTSYWRGGMWQGQGLCRQMNACQAAIELYFPGAPVHRGVVNTDPRGFAVMDGQIDFGFAFRLARRMF
jgi:hypothetical protein